MAMVVIIYLATTHESFPAIDEANDKLNHVLAFYVLAFLADYSAPKAGFLLYKGLPILGYGLLIEMIQYFLPYREFSVLDLVADGIGIAAYVLSRPLLSRLDIQRHRK